MKESPESEVTRILTSWPEASRTEGVLRVVRAMQERIDAEVRSQEACEDVADRERESRKAAERERDAHRQHAIQVERERDARVTLAQAKAWCIEMRNDAGYEVEDGGSTDDAPLPASLLAALANEERARGAGPSPCLDGAQRCASLDCAHTPSPEPLLALADAAMPIIRPQGFVQFGPNCAIHADKIAAPYSPIIRNAFLTWMESVERYHAAKGETGARASSPDPSCRAAGSPPEPPADLPCECGPESATITFTTEIKHATPPGTLDLHSLFPNPLDTCEVCCLLGSIVAYDAAREAQVNSERESHHA